jgi:hypothetical protein
MVRFDVASAVLLAVAAFKACAGPVTLAPGGERAWFYSHAKASSDVSGEVDLGKSNPAYAGVEASPWLIVGAPSGGQLVRIRGEVCCEVSPQAANVWLTASVGELPLMTYHGVAHGASRAGWLELSIVAALPAETTDVRVGFFNASGREVRARRLSIERLDAGTRPERLHDDFAQVLVAESVYLAGDTG